MYCMLTDSDEIMPMYWLVAAVTLGSIPRDRKRGLMMVPPAMPNVPESNPEKKHIPTR